MRPVRLEIEGLACFRDRQVIDFAALELFAICGPTGAGKSTLLDAMTFALYGEVPRVDSKSRTEMISAARDQAKVMLDFDVGADHYRIMRTLPRRGVNKVRLERREGAAWKSVAAQVREANDAVARILGLDASAFMQAVVLPQGEFARFLKAPPAKRREMLCALLGLDVYERMRDAAQGRAAERKAQVESSRKLLAEYGGEGGAAGEAAVAALAAAHAKVAGGLGGARAERDAAQAERDLLRVGHGKTRELGAAEAKQQRLLGEAEEVRRAEARLEAAGRAAALRALVDDAARAAGEAGEAERGAGAAGAREAAARAAHGKRAAAQRAAIEAAAAIDELRARIDRLNRVIGRFPERDRLHAALARREGERAALAQELAELEARAARAREAQAAQAAAVEDAKRAAEAAGYDAALDGALERVRDRAVELGAWRKAARERAAEVALAQEAAARLAAQVAALEAEARDLAELAEEGRRAADAAEAELDRAQRLDEANHLRACLGPGQACPVCEQIVAVPPAAGASPALEALRGALEGARARRRDAEERARRKEAQAAAAAARLLADRRSLAEAEARRARLLADVAAGEAALRQALGAHAPEIERADERAGERAITATIEAWIDAAIAAQASQRRGFEAARARAAEAERRLAEARTDERLAQERLEDRQGARQRLEAARAEDDRALAELLAELDAAAGGADPTAAAAAATRQIQRLEHDVRKADSEAAASRGELATAEEALRLKAEAAAAARAAAAELAARRDAAIARAGFADEPAVRAALLDDAAAAQLQARVHAHAHELHAARDRVAALERELAGARVSDAELLAAEQRAAALVAGVERAVGEESQLRGELERARQRLARAEELRGRLELEERGLRLYSQLAGDLRSDRFQAYLLAEVLAEIVRGASDRLRKLTGQRFSLQFDADEDKIVVVDHDNADETRISDTLSGGETFLASLALALELSEQVQRAAGAVRLDSLFIDEGFGTLDPDTLAIVAETIQGLRVGGRMVGIITHIPELRDELAQQIVVTKHPGYSTVKILGVAASPAPPPLALTPDPAPRA